jgi:hypothetical protein
MVAVEWDQDLDNMEVVMVQVVTEEILMGWVMGLEEWIMVIINNYKLYS